MSDLRSAIRACSTPSSWSKDGKVKASMKETVDLMNSIVWMDIEVGATYLKLRQIMEVTNGIMLDMVNEGFFSVTEEELEAAKDDADYLIDMCRSLGLKVEEPKMCRDGKIRTYRRWPRYGDIITLPRDWVIRYLARDAEPLEGRPDSGAVGHKYDDRWWSDTRDSEIGFEPDPVLEILTFKDVWENRAEEVAELVERGVAKTKCQAALAIMLEHSQQGEWDFYGNEKVAKRVYFTKEFRNYCYRNLMDSWHSSKPPTYAELTNYCWITIKSLVSKSYIQRTWNYKNEKGEYAFRRLYSWALGEMRSCRELTRVEELERLLAFQPHRGKITRVAES